MIPLRVLSATANTTGYSAQTQALIPQTDSPLEASEPANRPEQMSSRQDISDLLLGETELHSAVENAPFVKKLRAKEASKEEYMQYLANLRYGLVALESLFQDHSRKHPLLQDFKLNELYRYNLLLRDIHDMGVKECTPSNLVLLYDHARHFASLSEKRPYLLVAHLAVRYLAILFGGQLRAERLKMMWDGKAPTFLYSYSIEIAALRSSFFEQLNTYGQKLGEKQYQEFKHELKTAWEFAGDIVGVNIRALSRSLCAKL